MIVLKVYVTFIYIKKNMTQIKYVIHYKFQVKTVIDYKIYYEQTQIGT